MSEEIIDNTESQEMINFDFGVTDTEDEAVDIKVNDEADAVQDVPFDEAENRKKFLKSLTPEYKATMVLQFMENQEGGVRYYGHERKMFLRKLTRMAKKGRLDKYFK